MTELTSIAPTSRRTGIFDFNGSGALGKLRDEIDHLFEDMSSTLPARGILPFVRRSAELRPALELREANGNYCLSTELPGLSKDDVEIEFADGVLTISGEKTEASEEKEGNCLTSERSYGAFCRQVTLPGDVDPDKISAKFDKGVLTVTIAKDKSAASRTRKISVSG